MTLVEMSQRCLSLALGRRRRRCRCVGKKAACILRKLVTRAKRPQEQTQEKTCAGACVCMCVYICSVHSVAIFGSSLYAVCSTALPTLVVPQLQLQLALPQPDHEPRVIPWEDTLFYGKTIFRSLPPATASWSSRSTWKCSFWKAGGN